MLTLTLTNVSYYPLIYRPTSSSSLIMKISTICILDLKAQLQSVKHKIEIKINWLRLFSAQTDLNRTLSVASLVWTTDAEHSLETVTMRPSVEPEYVLIKMEPSVW